jgi:glutathione S-transferase
MLKVWGRLSSLNVQKSLLCVEEIGLPYERVDAGLHFGVTQSAEYKAMNPNSLVPTIDDDGFILWESNVIVRYLAAKHAPGVLWPNDPRARADVDRWMDWQQTSFNPSLTTMFRKLIREPESVSAQEMTTASGRVSKATAMLDAHLCTRAWIGGDSFGMADCVIAPSVHRWINLPVERQPHPGIERYYAALMQRPSAQKLLTLPLT